MVLLCGIEEAGRGPIVGPMVMCGLLINEEDEPKLKAIGAKDSKMLTPKQREGLFGQILKISIRHKVVILSPQEIDAAVGRGKDCNLNWLEAETSAKMINELKPDKVLVDCPSPNINAYTARLRKMLENKEINILCAHHADVNFPVVSASSIIAKVTRDAEIEKIKKKIGKNFGSGYPADPVTKEFVKEHYMDYPDIIRHSWAPYKEIIKQRDQKKIGEF